MNRFRTFAAALALTAAMGAPSAHALTRAEIMAAQQAQREEGALTQVERDGSISATTVSTFAGANAARQFAAQRGRGENNVGTVVQNGNNNGAYVRQRGQNLGVTVVQNNNNNRAYVAQVGHDMGLGLTQNGGERTVVIQTQTRTIVRDMR